MKPPVIGLNGVEWVYQKVSSLEGPGINLTGINKTWNPRTQPAFQMNFESESWKPYQTLSRYQTTAAALRGGRQRTPPLRSARRSAPLPPSPRRGLKDALPLAAIWRNLPPPGRDSTLPGSRPALILTICLSLAPPSADKGGRAEPSRPGAAGAAPPGHRSRLGSVGQEE